MCGWANYTLLENPQSMQHSRSNPYSFDKYREDFYESYWASSASQESLPPSLPPRKQKWNRKRRNESLPSVVLKARRLTVNARERHRMKGLNDAYDKLRKVVLGSDTKHKLSKYATLQIAQTYITALRDVLRRQDEMYS